MNWLKYWFLSGPALLLMPRFRFFNDSLPRAFPSFVVADSDLRPVITLITDKCFLAIHFQKREAHLTKNRVQNELVLAPYRFSSGSSAPLFPYNSCVETDLLTLKSE